MNILLFMGMFCACSNSDESSDDYTGYDGQCYTIRINRIDEYGVVSGNLINKPQETTFIGYTNVLFDISDLSSIDISSGDEVDIKILSYKLIIPNGYSTGQTCYYYCKVNVCK